MEIIVIKPADQRKHVGGITMVNVILGPIADTTINVQAVVIWGTQKATVRSRIPWIKIKINKLRIENLQIVSSP